MSHSLATVALPRSATVLTAAMAAARKQSRQRPNPNTQNGKRKITTTNPGVPPAATVKKTTSGFNSRNKEPTWQCVQNCGACCKLEKGPNFPTPEEIFDDPSDIEQWKPAYAASAVDRTASGHGAGREQEKSVIRSGKKDTTTSPLCWTVSANKMVFDQYQEPIRNWILTCLWFLTVGILLGSWWAYHELGQVAGGFGIP